MYIQLSKNSYVRIYDEGSLGYIINQLSSTDRIYDETGADFLAQLSREPRSMEDIIKSLCELYGDAPKEVIAQDFVSWAEELHAGGFILMGETQEAIEAQEKTFSYAAAPGKESVNTQRSSSPVGTTQDFLLAHDKKKPRLACLQVEITGRCNERCVHCYLPDDSKNFAAIMPFERFKTVIDQYAAMNGLVIGLTGGEALLNRDITKMLRYCREKDLKISLLSNLTLLKREIAEVLKEVNVSSVQVSLYSMNPDIHDTITNVNGSFEKTKRAIELLHSMDVPVIISCPVMKENRHGFIRVIEYGEELGIPVQTDYIMMARINGDTSNLCHRLSLDETEEFLTEIIEYDKAHTVTTEQTMQFIPEISEDELMEQPMCGAGINDLSMAANGDVFPCSGWQGWVVGNVFKTSLREIWDNSPQLKMLRNVSHRDFPKCLKCQDRDYCSMCMVRNFNESGGDMFHQAEHFCEVAHLTKRLAENPFNKL